MLPSHDSIRGSVIDFTAFVRVGEEPLLVFLIATTAKHLNPCRSAL